MLPPVFDGSFAGYSTDTCAGLCFRDNYRVFFEYKKNYMAEARRELMRGITFSRYEQFETSPETIEQELRPAVCELRQTELRRIIVYMMFVYIHFSSAITLCYNVLRFGLSISVSVNPMLTFQKSLTTGDDWCHIISFYVSM